MNLPESWRRVVGEELEKPYFWELRERMREERRRGVVCPPEGEEFAALEATSFAATRVVLLGQDPYHGEGQAHGLSFSVPPGTRPPPSLANIFKELRADVGCPVPSHGCLRRWAEQGVLLLNTVLAVRAGEAGSLRGIGWELFTDAVIVVLNRRVDPVVFLLWGAHAIGKKRLIDAGRHPVIESVHPSPLSAHRGFFGSRPFSRVNAELERLGGRPIDWGAGG